MRTWFTTNLGDPVLAGDSLDRIRARYVSEYGHSHGAQEPAVFVRHESAGDLHCAVQVYFSPAAARVAQAFGALPCDRPAADGLGLLAGPEAVWPVLFPGHGL
ncbi:MAG: hypothetical protein PVI50_06985 [Gammaproteobacteria bacterium]|jgi:hypothetical protein